jgi:hypothetical protein
MVTNPLRIIKKVNKVSGCQMSLPSQQPFSFGLNTTAQNNSKGFNDSNTMKNQKNTSLCVSFNEIYGLNLT